jgi:hypothetical protein
MTLQVSLSRNAISVRKNCCTGLGGQSLQRQGLRPVYRRAYVVTTDSAHHLPVAPNVLDRRFDGWHQAWTSDIT